MLLNCHYCILFISTILCYGFFKITFRTSHEFKNKHQSRYNYRRQSNNPVQKATS
jgi:hypothetical protein